MPSFWELVFLIQSESCCFHTALTSWPSTPNSDLIPPATLASLMPHAPHLDGSLPRPLLWSLFTSGRDITIYNCTSSELFSALL